MKVQVLLATMNQTDSSILKKMNIHSDIIIGNQCSWNEVKDELYDGHHVKWLSFAERGVGLNRNNVLMRANADIGLMADDDVIYENDYVQIVSDFFEKHPDADVVVFNMKVKRNGEEFKDIVKQTRKITRKQATSYGTFCLGVRISSIRHSNIYFHRDFGGGAAYSCGEDTIFLQDCFKKGLKVYTCVDVIGVVDHGPSTWFNGYNEKYFLDKGVLFIHLYPHTYKLIALYHSVKHRSLYKEYGWKNAFKTMCEAKKIDRRR